MNSVSNEVVSVDANLIRESFVVPQGNFASIILEYEMDSSTGALPQIRSEVIHESFAAPARNRASILDSDHDENYSRMPIVSNEGSLQA